jgi:hypothetical protein
MLGARPVGFTQCQGGRAHDTEQERDLVVVSHPAENGETRLTVTTHRRVVALHEREGRGCIMGRGPRFARAGAPSQEPLETLASLCVVPAQLPEAPKRGADPQTDLHLPALCRPGQRCAHVCELGVEPLEPAQLLRPA